MFYGWILVAALCVVYLLGIGPAFYGFGVALPATAEGLGLSRTEASIGFSALALLLGLSGPITAMLMRKIGIRFTVALGSVLIGIGASLVALTGSFAAYVIGAVIMGFGVGFMTVLPLTTLISTWFARRRALAMGIFLTSGGVGGFLSANVVRSVIESTGTYRSAWWLMAGSALAGGVIALFFVRESPAAMGQYPDGIDPATETGVGEAARTSKVYQTSVDWEPAKAMRTATFWFIVLGQSTFGLGVQIVNSQLVAHLTGIGATAAVAASALGTMALLSAFARLIGGTLGDRIEPRYLLAVGLAGQLAGILFLTQATTSTLIYLFVVLFGGGYGIAYLAVPPLVANYFGPTAYASLFGVLLPVATVVGALGPIIAGAVFDATGGYGAVFVGFAALAGMTVLTSLLARPPDAPHLVAELAAE